MSDWDRHYKEGGVSGDPSDYARSIKQRQDIIRRYIGSVGNTVLDLGCGDLQFWDGYSLGSWYTGVDISETIIHHNQTQFPQANFKVNNIADYQGEHVDVVLCADVLFHIIDDLEYIAILKNISAHAKRRVIIKTWSANPLNTILSRLMRLKATGTFTLGENTTDEYHQKYRAFEKYIPVMFDDFRWVSSDLGIYILEREEKTTSEECT
jgi:2-polyprenyl-3-methyl-5-hydroxy-6-metoxy-1,4-benzoquinol methylase